MSVSMIEYRLASLAREIDTIRTTPNPTDRELRELAMLEGARYNLLLQKAA